MKPIAPLFILVVILAVSAFGQTTSRVVSSPYELAKLVNDTGSTRPVLELGSVWQRLGVAPGSFNQCGEDCSAAVSALDLDGKPGREVLLKLTGFSERCRFLVFKRHGKAWRVVGHVDHDFNRYQMARHRVVRFKGKPWLLIRGQEGSGSGFSLYVETWYQVSQAGLRAVLSYPVAGTTYPWPAGLGREFKTQAITGSESQNDLVLRFVVRYIKLDYETNKPLPFIVNEHRAHFHWDRKTNSFAFNSARSDISEADISAIANIEAEENSSGTNVGSLKFYSGAEQKAWVGGGYEVFLKYNLARLMKIASDKNNKHREWLRLFLKDCYDTGEKKTLVAALEKGR
ncbi:MAG: hypothetical protein WAL47_01210 [Pyrinomonadaceae bacterium]